MNDSPRPVWFYSSGDGMERFGPVTKADLEEKFSKGELDSETLVWCPDLDDWTPVSSVEKLKDVAPLSPPPLPALRNKENVTPDQPPEGDSGRASTQDQKSGAPSTVGSPSEHAVNTPDDPPRRIDDASVNIPPGYISVEEASRRESWPVAHILGQVKLGSRNGQQIDGKWYVQKKAHKNEFMPLPSSANRRPDPVGGPSSEDRDRKRSSNLIPIAIVAERERTNSDRLIEAIRRGERSGQMIGGQWHVQPLNESGDRIQDSPSHGPVGIAGWLVLPALWLTFGPVALMASILVNNKLLGNRNGMLAEMERLTPGITQMIETEVAFGYFLIAFTIIVAICFFKKLSIVPNLMVGWIVVKLSLMIYGLSELSSIGLLESEDHAKFVTTALFSLIWIAYFLKSERVKNTFVN